MLNKIYRGELYPYHLCGLSGGSISVVPNSIGAGANATASLINGDDTSGIIQLVTSILDTPNTSSIILTVTFANKYPSGTPRVFIQPANVTAWGLTYGIIQIIDANNSGSAFVLSSGSIPLPATTAATYQWSYLVIGRSV